MNKTVLNNIYEDIVEISCKSLQTEIWLGKNPNRCSSFTEVMCRLFDDNNFIDFLNHSVYELDFSVEIIYLLKALFDKLENYSELATDEEIINDPNWEEIGNIASEIVALWDKEKYNF